MTLQDSRSYKAGFQLGETIKELAHLFYQLDTMRRFFLGLFASLKKVMDEVQIYIR